MGLFESHVPIDSITIMVQKEVADRMVHRDEGLRCALAGGAVLCKAGDYRKRAAELLYAAAECRQRGVIRLTRHETVPVQVEDES